MTRSGVIAAAVLLGSATFAQVPTSELAKPPANARQFTIVSTAGPHGESWKAQDRTGSIEVDKVADLVPVEGDPSKRIGDLRHTRVVMMDGRLMDAGDVSWISVGIGRQ